MRSCVFHALVLLLISCSTSFSTSFSTFTFQGSAGREARQCNDADDESFIGLMGKRTSGLTAELPLKRDVGDVFVRLFGRRNADPGLAAWRRATRGGVFGKSRRLGVRRSI